ncbi:envelope biogenesis factor ElyC [Martelella alba]|uniref:Envelope biogenesis factor ElyC n=1 Tax=Martelella alba TaxID=2590451 RepID=A0ABY2SPG6_9HYPH|nr:envelope biogenesis factor ElyC [Martelella alba]TKI07498.1 envelope biogenesis factor ElyC [Martelella alba]
MFFTLKKLVGGLLLPLPLLLLLMAAGLCLIGFTRRQKTGKCLLVLGWLALLLLSLQPVADHLLAPLETRYPTYQDRAAPIAYVVVLGGGYTFNPQWAPGSNLINNSLPRVVEGIRQYRNHPGARLVFTGAAANGNPVSSAAVAASVAESLGVPAKDIILLDKPRDTRQEAASVAALVGKAPFLLVTSANHLPRAMAFFQGQGLAPLPAPANQLAITSPLNVWERLLPSPLWLEHSERAWYETLGRIWQKISGPGR